MKHYLRLLLNVACVLGLVFCFACAKKQIKDEQIEAPAESDLNANEFQDITDPALKAIFQDLRFDYDRFVLKPEAKKTLTGIAGWLKQNTGRRVLVEGHCDARGTAEYNLALGERRANSAKTFLIEQGVAEKSIATISYGKERPTCEEAAESCYAKNRRDHFLLSK
jgi:peptidoglycan-associated lipoprotein